MDMEQVKYVRWQLDRMDVIVNDIHDIAVNVDDMKRWDALQVALKEIAAQIDVIRDNTY